MTAPDPQKSSNERIIARMSRVDAMSAEMRGAVHEYGLTIVDAFLQCGVTKVKHMHHLVRTIRTGSVERGNHTDQPGKKLA